MKRLLLLAAALWLAATPALAAPVILLESTTGTNADPSVSGPATGSCAIGKTAVAAIAPGNTAAVGLTDSVGNTWTAGVTTGVISTFRMRLFATVVTAAIVSGTTTFTTDLGVANIPFLAITCYDGTALGIEATVNPGLAAQTSNSLTTATLTGPPNTVVMAQFNSAGTSFAQSWGTAGATTGGAFGLRTFYKVGTNGPTETYTSTHTSGSTILGYWALQEPAPPPPTARAANGPTMGCC